MTQGISLGALAKGRPLGLMMSWLWAGGASCREEHVSPLVVRATTHAERLAGRQRLAEILGGLELLNCERDAALGVDIEPDF